MTTSKINYSHGDSGSQPADGTDFVSGEAADPQTFDWYISTFVSKINSLAGDINDIQSGAVIVGNADQVDGKDYADIQNWVNTSADVPNADHADDADTLAGDTPDQIRPSVSDEGTAVDNHPTDINFTGSATASSDGDGTVTISTTDANTHVGVDDEGAAVANDPDRLNFIGAGVTASDSQSDGVIEVSIDDEASTLVGTDGTARMGGQMPQYQTKTDAQNDADVTEGTIVYILDQNQFYYEDGT